MSELYRAAGVNIDAGNEAVERMKKHVAKTMRKEALLGLGGFGGAFALDVSKYKEPVLISGTDGVGTKLKLAFALNQHDTIGIDAVAMCVNDIVVMGAEPLYFLDYLAIGQLLPEVAEQVVAGIATGCVDAGCALIGGETAEMPGMYQAGEYDIAGFAVGIVEKAKMITGANIQAGDVLIGLASSGVHSNGFSLVRKVLLEDGKLDLQQSFGDSTIGETLLTPTRIYVKTILDLLQTFSIKGMAHITGGGFIENIPRVLPAGLGVTIEKGSWPILPIFDLIQTTGQIPEFDMYRTLNMGIGMVLVVDAKDAEAVLDRARALGEAAYRIGAVATQEGVSLTSKGGAK
ncbi:phosphoribosylformylglycinamidine cyclo-ligase [Fodinisporobacter ferrooxydans]|uniref:Phosphoribosylformylglycinamidine cyclo-ligase n=1 Tax=Fodinisporobacter ferrooxydans TaxID=2901836 RepID=A0ABY4CP06_9BACL|nr:phosphoribosylformylglycinamidine cyclo-ligase [Alicyclobacillaceae bacterium MYW30-H2]